MSACPSAAMMKKFISLLYIYCMHMIKAIFKNAWPYQKDKMNLPVRDLESSIPFYETVMGFSVVTRNELPYKLAVLDRDGIQIGLGENGGDPTQDGCFFEVDNIHLALEELKSNGLQIHAK